jgi:hypothetical protein
MPEETAADRLEKDPRPKGEAVSRGPLRRGEEKTPATAAPGTDAQEKVHPKKDA